MNTQKPSNVLPLHPRPHTFRIENVKRLPFYRNVQLARQSSVNLALDTDSALRMKKFYHPALDFLLGELELWRLLLGNRPIECLELTHPTRGLEPYEITSFIHRVASTFNIRPLDERSHRVVCAFGEIKRENLALFKGLGFNQIQVLISDNADLAGNALERALSCTEDFQFSRCGVQIIHAGSLEALVPKLRSVCKNHKVDYILTGKHSTGLRIEFNQTKTRLLVEENDIIKNNVICLGPEAISCINGVQIENWCSITRYTEAIKSHILPFSVVQEV